MERLTRGSGCHEIYPPGRTPRGDPKWLQHSGTCWYVLHRPRASRITTDETAHLNIRDQYLPYKNIIAQVLLDKNPHIKTVINKIDNVGSENEFRTFAYEVLGGPDDLNVEVSEAGCVFKFDYSKVYWNSKLDTEHKRIAGLFKPGEVVADVMAGIGPFAVPAGKKGVFVWANDKNPESYRYLEDAIRKNKVSSFSLLTAVSSWFDINV